MAGLGNMGPRLPNALGSNIRIGGNPPSPNTGIQIQSPSGSAGGLADRPPALSQGAGWDSKPTGLNRGWNPLAAGNKVYGGGRPMPTIGPVDKTGYKARNAPPMNAARNAVMRRLTGLQQQKSGRLTTPDVLRSLNSGGGTNIGGQ